MVTTSRPQLHRVTCSNKTPIPAAPADRRHGRYLHVPGTNNFKKKNMLMGKKKTHHFGKFSPGSLVAPDPLERCTWPAKVIINLSQQGKMPEIPAASSVSCHDGRKDSSTCHLKFSWNLLNFSVFRTERAVFTSQIWTILGNLGNHSYNYNTQVQLHPLNVLQHQGQRLFHLSDMRSCKKQTEKTQILRTWLQKTAGVSNPNVVPCPAGTADSLTVQFEL